MQDGSEVVKVTGFIYVIGSPAPALGPVKIGYSGEPVGRLNQIKMGTACLMPDGMDTATLEILYRCEGSQLLEQALHHHFRKLRVIGEWFRLDPAVAPREVKMAIASWPHWAHVVGRESTVELGAAKPAPTEPESLVKTATNGSKANVYERGRAYANRASQSEIELVAIDVSYGSPAELVASAKTDRFVDQARRHYALFSAWKVAGFTEDQSLKMVVMMASSG